jgi:hypothetical protein
MNWKESGRNFSWSNLGYFPGIFLEILKKIMKAQSDL